MPKITREIKDLYDKYKTPNRDKDLIARIIQFTKENQNIMLDGLVNNTLTMGPQLREKFIALYQLGNEFATLKNNPYVKRSEIVNNPLRCGLLSSYSDEKNRLILTFLFLLNYSACINKYWRNGHDNKRMAYVLDNLINNNTDFKKYRSILNVSDKKVESFEIRAKDRFKDLNDENMAYLAQDSYTRANNSINVIASKYYEMDEETIKFIKKNVVTKDGRAVISMNTIFDNIIRKAKEGLAPNNQIMTAIGCDPFKTQNEIRIDFITFALVNQYYKSCDIIEKLIYEFQKRNSGVDHKVFKKKFSTMIAARNLTEINKEIDEIIQSFNEARKVTPVASMKMTYKKDLLSYLVIYTYRIGLITMLN